MKKVPSLLSTIIRITASLRKASTVLLMIIAIMAGLTFDGIAQTTITTSVISSSDDAEQQGPTGTSPGAVNLTSNDLEMVNDLQDPSVGAQIVGMRFQSLNIPQGAIITSAYITFTCVSADAPMDNTSTTSLILMGQAADNAPTFITATNNISSRTLTTASVAWTPDAWLTGSKYNTPIVTSIVQEIVNRAGWVSGNSLAIIITGSGHRSAASWDDVSSSNEPKLVVTFTTMSLTTSVTNVLCYGASTGVINLTVTGGVAPYTFDWSNDGFGLWDDPEDLSGIPAGNYVVKVKDNTGMTAETFAAITQPGSSVNLSTIVTMVSAPGGSNGAVDLTVTGGTPGYTYAWTKQGGGFSASTEDISNIQAGTYNVTVTDINGCTATTSAVVGSISNPASVTKYLYLSDPSQALDRVDPVFTNDLTTASTAIMGIGLPKRIFAFGGNNTTNFWEYSMSGNTWTAKAVAPAAVRGGGALTTNGVDIFALRGNGQTAFWKYTVSTNTWSTLASTPAAVNNNGGGALVYTPGGTSGYIFAFQGQSTTFWRYDIAANTWSTMAAAPATVGYGGSLVYNGANIYAMEGDGKKLFWRYNIGSNTWTVLAPTPANVGAGGSLTFDGTYIYALEGNATKLFWQYNISANTWTAKASTAANMGAGAGLTFDGTYIYALRGGGQSTYYRYDRTANTWSAMTSTPVNVSDGGSITTVGDGLTGVSSVTFTESPSLCQNLTVLAGTITVTAYATVTGGTMPANPNITAAIKYGASTLITLTNPTYNSTTGLLTWTGTLGSNTTIPSGNAIALQITTAQSGVAFTLNYDSKAKPSKITMAVSNYIVVNSITVYDAPYPSVSVPSTIYTNGTYFIRVSVSDPFGAVDVNGVTLLFTKPGPTIQTVNLGAANVVSNNGCTKIYQYTWAGPSPDGSWNIQAIAKEGTEGVTYIAASGITVVYQAGTAIKTKSLYLSDPAQALDRVDPVSTSDVTIASTSTLGLIPSTIAVETSATANGDNIASLTTPSLTFGAGGNRILLVGVSFTRNGGDPTITSVTYGASTLTLYASSASGSGPYLRTHLYYLLNPTSGSTVTVNFGTIPDKGAVVGALVFNNVNSTSVGAALGTAISNTGTFTTPSTTPPTVIVSSASIEKVMDVVLAYSSAGLTPGTGQTEYWDATPDACNGGGSVKTGAASTTMTWTPSASGAWSITAVPVKPSITAGLSSVTFTESPALCSNLNIKAGKTITVSTYVNISYGSMPANPAITASLRYGPGPTTIPLSWSAASYNSGTGVITWTGTLNNGGSDFSVPSGNAISLLITNSQTNVGYEIQYDASSKPSKIDLPVDTYIDITTTAIYNAAYAGGTTVTSGNIGTPVYIRTRVVDPFGTSDITGVTVTIDGTDYTSVFKASPASCTSDYEYAWTPSSSGDYNITVTAKEGTENTVADYHYLNFSVCGFTVTPVVSIQPSCFYANGGQVSLDITGSEGPFSGTWTRISPAGSGSISGTTINGLSAGSYNLSVTSAGGCTSTDSVTLDAPTPPAVSSTVSNASCLGNNGAIDVTVSGGSGSYVYFWEDGYYTQSRSGLVPGHYVLHVTDQGNGCTTTISGDVQRENDISGSAFMTQPSCYGGNNGSLNLTAIGGSGTYTTYQWIGPNAFTASTEDISGLFAGVYTVLIADDGGCNGTVSFEVTQPNALAIAMDTTNVKCYKGGSINITVTGGTLPYTYD